MLSNQVKLRRSVKEVPFPGRTVPTMLLSNKRLPSSRSSSLVGDWHPRGRVRHSGSVERSGFFKSDVLAIKFLC